MTQTDLIFSPEQAAAYDSIMNWMDDPSKQTFLLSGAAGCGKTTLLTEVVKKLKERNFKIFTAAPSNKAVGVLKQKNKIIFADATTIHKLLYKSTPINATRPPTLAEQHQARIHNKELPKEIKIIIDWESTPADIKKCDLIVIDEASMISTADVNLLLMSKIKVLFVGDGFQLQPVNNRPWFFEQKYDALLTKIHRTAETSEIAILGEDIRNNGPEVLDTAKCQSEVHRMGKMKFEHEKNQILKNVDIVLCFTNYNCARFNKMNLISRGLWSTKEEWKPMVGALLFSREKYKHKIAKSCFYKVLANNGRIFNNNGQSGWQLDLLNIETNQKIYNVVCNTLSFKDAKIDMTDGMAQMGFGYAITVHKAQGSEFDNVLLIDDKKNCKHNNDYKSWLYTGVTRAKKNLYVVVNF